MKTRNHETQPPPTIKALRRVAITALAAALLAGTATPGPATADSSATEPKAAAREERPELLKAMQAFVDADFTGVQLSVHDERGEWTGRAGVPSQEELVARMVRTVVEHDWTEYGGEHPLVAMLRSSAHEDARQRIRTEVCDTYVNALRDLAEGEDAELRAELLSAWMVGIGILRSVVATPALAEARASGLAPHVATVATGLLGRPMSGTVDQTGESSRT
ncbi:hypothetical protein AB0K12_39825 [Nonomuraea sp. NPDC049419]|uniref:TetR/AcrR family transcriptional regulator n=1 Tax=Nonomuraea sp. NPDC049419 TaxID=3155772 RepID=UPI003422CF9B